MTHKVNSAINNNASSCLEQLKFILLDPKQANQNQDLYNIIYTHWKNVWSEVLNLNQSLSSDAFARQDIIYALMEKDEVAGIICSSFYPNNLLSSIDHSYFTYFPKDTLKQEMLLPHSNLMTLEYLSSTNKWRKSNLGFSLGSVLFGLAMKKFETSNASCILSSVRKVVGVDKISYDFGFQSLGDIEKYGHPCTLVINKQSTLKEHPSEDVRAVVNSFWERKTDLTVTKPAEISHKKVA